MYRAIQGVVKGVDTITAEGTMEYPKTREEWLALRHKHIASTEVAAFVVTVGAPGVVNVSNEPGVVPMAFEASASPVRKRPATT